MFGKLFCYFILVCLAKSVTSQDIESCYSNNSDPYPYTGTKTAYHYVYNGTEEPVILPHCKPRQIWLLCRHGTRYPNKNVISKVPHLTHLQGLIVNNHETNQNGYLCEKDLQMLKDWKPNLELDEKKTKDLTAQGEKDLATLGERLRVKFPELFSAEASENYKFRSTDTQRTIASMESFIKGAFGDKFAANQEIIPLANDTLLKVYKTCEPWLEVRNSSKADEQMQAFIDGPEVAKVVANVNRRLGFTKDISKDDVFLIYDACRFEKAWYPDKVAPWCVAFNDDEMRVLEYEEDLFYYYHMGYGLEINSKLGCQPLRDMLDRFAKLERTKNHDGLKGVFYFTHSQMMMLFFTALGIGRDAVPITASNFRDMKDRNWRASLLVPFATNFAAVFYSCDTEDSPFKVAFYLAENPLTLDGCENGVCDWMQLKKKLGDIAADCSTEFCQRNA